MLLMSEEGSAGFSKALALTGDTIEVRALKEAKVGLDCDVSVTGALTVVSTGDLATSDALIRQGSTVTAGEIVVEASRGATLGPSTVIDVAGALAVRSTGIGAGERRHGVAGGAGGRPGRWTSPRATRSPCQQA